MRAIVITPPAPVVTWEEVRHHVRLEADDERQSFIMGLVAAATIHIDGPDGWLGRAIGPQTIEARFDCLEGCRDYLRLPCPPTIDLVSVKYLDGTGGEQGADLADFYIFGDRIGPESGMWAWTGCAMHPEAIRIRYRAGYVADPAAEPLVAAVPAPIRVAIAIMAQRLFEGMSVEDALAGSAAMLLAQYRVFS